MWALKPAKNLRYLPLWAKQGPRKPLGLLEATADAKESWLLALHDLNLVDQIFVDYAIHNINAAERRYMALLLQAKKEGLTAWPGYTDLQPLATEDSAGDETQDNSQELSAG